MKRSATTEDRFCNNGKQTVPALNDFKLGDQPSKNPRHQQQIIIKSKLKQPIFNPLLSNFSKNLHGNENTALKKADDLFQGLSLETQKLLAKQTFDH